ncbi:ERF family protein [Acinetobacter towneri]|uniref:Essential recombination function protein n=1 Tax=Acinetobacter towneri TaxID=202956 RepID=A0AAP9KIX0_9GAMM|nr:ERF family protein [Acinetobacter towneri]QGM27358.1 Essential recombination function protein [Acinetobacter towneri]
MNAQVEICLDDLVAIQHELKAPKDKTNTFGKYKYRSCESILEAVKPLLHKYGCKLTLSDDSKEMCGIPVVIAIATFIDSKGNQTVVKAEAGVEINKKGMDVAQTFGASSSYARKYALNGLFLIDDTKDADSNEFHNQYQAQQNQQPRQQQAYQQPRQQQVQQPQKHALSDAQVTSAIAKIKAGSGTKEALYKAYIITDEQKQRIESEVAA